MKYNLEKHHRRSVRLKGYDYFSTGAYFVTICTWNRDCLFGEIIEGKIELNEYGKVVQQEWMHSGDIRPNVELDEYVIMPNHFHGIVIINAGNICRGMARHAPTGRQFAKPIANSLSTIIGAFKSAVTKLIKILRKNPGMPVWQRNYFERVIRNEKELFRIREYICFNPVQWDMDEENPANIKIG
jgi:REP element-mobilizing transposase RayT